MPGRQAPELRRRRHTREPKRRFIVYCEGQNTERAYFGACDRDLPPDSPDARICSFECTFCAACAAERLAGVCPNCGGELVRRPIRPPAALARFPASTERIVKPSGCGEEQIEPLAVT
jgi:uncharacterized protein